MARIPLGNFGNVIADPAPRVNIPAGAFNAGEGAQKLGDTGMRVAAGLMEDKRQQQDALGRVKAANALQDYQIAVKTVGLDMAPLLADGTISSADADTEYKKLVDAIPKPDHSGYDAITAERISGAILQAQAEGRNSVAPLISGAVVLEQKSAVDLGLDKIGKLAGLPGADVPAELARLNAYDAQGLKAYGKNWAAKKQEFTDKAWANHAQQRVLENRDNMNGLVALEKDLTKKDGFYATTLDGDKRTAMMARVELYKSSIIQRQEAAAARIDREAERRLRAAEAEFNTLQSMVDKGTVLDPNYIERAMQVMAGTPYQKAVTNLAQVAKETGGLARQPIAAQKSALTAIDQLIATQGRSPELDKRREQVARVLSSSETDVKARGLSAGLERGVIDNIAPLDMTSLQSIVASGGLRLQQADVVSNWSGQAVSPLDGNKPVDGNEPDQLKAMLDILPPKQRAAAITTLSTAIGARHSAAIAAQLDAKDRPLGLAFAVQDGIAAEMILRGAAAIKDGAVMQDSAKVTGWKAKIAQQVNGLYPDATLGEAAKESAYLIAGAIAQDNGGRIWQKDIEKAVKMAVGGDIFEQDDGSRIPLPKGMDEDAFIASLKSERVMALVFAQSTEGKVIAGGVPVDAGELVKSLPGQKLMYAGPGRYAVMVRGRPVLSAAGKPIIIQVQ